MEKIKIAITEDHRLLRESIKMLLEKNGDFDVLIEALDGQDLLDKLEKSTSIDLILIDINMPGMDGIEATGIVKQRWSSIKIVALSLIDSQDVIDKFYGQGGDLYLIHGLPKEKLTSELLRIMNR
ncbi:response regulator [Spirosoma endophyticum]|uniref:Response regulator receiver domain-containing protein n=1 Tax=Spirosoma endophyticum TaxID=662367 RepID=A0A1I1GHW0_9BACT|nr:response regulator transcription factor [Spirosoma endophyticum]SFC11091.1 Response regulator receiver domain-containing protein [Spirosoma endophyticum]